MFRLARIMDELDDLRGMFRAAGSGAYVFIVFLIILMAVLATLTLGLRGLLVSSLVGGVAIAAATLSSTHN